MVGFLLYVSSIAQQAVMVMSRAFTLRHAQRIRDLRSAIQNSSAILVSDSPYINK